MDAITFSLRHAVFTTRLFATLTKRGVDSASRTLNRLAARGQLAKVTRGIWAQTAHPAFTPFAAVGFLLGNEQGHVSFVSALHRHGVISQIPGAIHVATTGHSRVVDSPIGRFEFFRLRPQMMLTGVDVSATDPFYPIATPEKALLDTVYVALWRRRFKRLPELDLESIDGRRVYELLERQVTALPFKKALVARLGELGIHADR
ncbi:MAG: hypothetical protein OXU77_19150 [Gammaproteobacteria bacterium]|nr:hypothetical protein [Gammaproteobacteria bacterium]MDE0441021.1 hypothetical protein [Gammaproteobacteria bacterium]